MSTTIGKPNTLDLLISLHDKSVREVTSTKGGRPTPDLKDGLAMKNWGYHISKERNEEEGFEELARAQILLYPNWITKQLRPEYPQVSAADTFGEMASFYCSRYNLQKKYVESTLYDTESPREGSEQRIETRLQPSLNNYSKSIQEVTTREEILQAMDDSFRTIQVTRVSVGSKQIIETRLQPFFNHYSKSIQEVTTLEGKLQAIADLLRTIEVSHIFPDGNQRTVAFLMLNKLLIENNLPPALLDEPVMFDGFVPLKEMGKQIKKGMANFLYEGKEANVNFTLNSCQDILSLVHQREGHFVLQSNIDSDYVPFSKVFYKPSFFDDIKRELKEKIQTKITEGNLSYSDEEGLMIKAVLYGDDASALALLENSMDPVNALIPMQYAAEIGNEKLFLELLSHIGKKVPYEKRAESEFANSLSTLIARNADLKNGYEGYFRFLPKEVLNNKASSYILTAIDSENIHALRGLISAGIAIHTYRPTRVTPLVLAVEKTDAFFNFVLEHTPDVNESTQAGTALLVAIEDGKVHMVKKLLERGAKITSTEIEIAQESSSEELKKLIIPHY